ncbi:MAG: GNAT family N-acetyltransferase [Solirubrobacterales bacterium]
MSTLPASAGAVEVRPVSGRRDLRRFIEVPYRLRAADELWVPPLRFERRQFLSPRHNPFLRRAGVQLLLAWRDGEVVGRISAHHDPRYDELYGGADGMFGFFEAIDDPEVAVTLLDAAAGWLRERGRDRMIGPMDFTTNDECGLLIDGYERPPMILQPWHPPYYRELLGRAGGAKAIDLLMWELDLGRLKQGDEFHPAIHAVAEKVSSEHGVTVRKMRRRDLDSEIAAFIDVYNEAWSHNWAFVPIDREEASFYAKTLRPVIDPNWAFIAERDGEVLGAALSLPDVNEATKAMGGRLFPLGWARFLRDRRRVQRVRVFALGVKPEYQHLGIAAALYVKHRDAAASDDDLIRGGEMGWILETNDAMNRAMEGMGGSVVKRYRIYKFPLGSGGGSADHYTGSL